MSALSGCFFLRTWNTKIGFVRPGRFDQAGAPPSSFLFLQMTDVGGQMSERSAL